jgi:hypothetical protein
VRRYLDRDGVVHEASDLGLGNRITQCERETDQELYDTRELSETERPTTCLQCLVVPEWRKRMTST